MIRAPKEIASVVRAKTLSIKNELFPSKCEEYNSPLNFYDQHFSRFVVAIINEKKTVTTGNIKVDEIADIDKRTDFIYNKDMEKSFMPAIQTHSTQSSPGWTVVLSVGNGMKGKTPVQFLLENPEENKVRLSSQYKWLKDNLGKNPQYDEGNKRQMEAIMDASRLFKEGKLNGIDAAPTPKQEFVIYDSGLKPLVRKVRQNGKCFVYTVKITWTIGNKYPVTVAVDNFYAPVTKTPDGLYNVQSSQKEDEVKNFMRISAKEWNHIIYMIKTNMRTFENIHAPHLYKTAVNAESENRRAAGIPDRQ